MVFSEGSSGPATAPRLLMELFSFQKRPGIRNPRLWVNGAALAGAVAFASRHRLHHDMEGRIKRWAG